MQDDPGGSQLRQIYSARFAGKTDYRIQVWLLLAEYFSRWVPARGVVMDLGAGYCEFINSITAAVKYAMDLNPETLDRAAMGVQVLQQDCSQPWPLADSALDSVFTSNFLEHLPNKDAVRQTLANAYRCLNPGGCLIAMGPNIKYVPGAYWDFFDHYVELTEMSLAECLVSCGFRIERQIGRFLPYTMSQGRQYPMWILRFYLALPMAWPFFGKQFLVVARKPAV